MAPSKSRAAKAAEPVDKENVDAENQIKELPGKETVNEKATEKVEEEEESSSGEEESESDSDEDDFLSGLSAEQLAKIKERQEALKKQYQKFDKVQTNNKKQDVMNATGVTEEEAGIAIECCNGDELEAAQRLATESDFLDNIKQMAEEAKWRRENPYAASKNGINVSIDWNGKKLSNGCAPRVKRTENGIKAEKGYKLDGGKRAKNIRLGDALANLKKMKKQKSQEKTIDEEIAKDAESASNDQKAEETETVTEKDDVKKTWKVNSKIEAKWSGDNEYYPGKVEKVNKDDTYNVLFDDGESEANIKAENIRDLPGKNKKGKAKKAESKKVSKAAKAPEPKKEEKNEEKKESEKKSDDSEAKKEDQKDDEEEEYTPEELLSLGWSEARVKAFLARKKNPNSYYYRFNAPGEPQGTGNWSQTEIDIFMEQIKDLGVSYRWGEFSMAIPGRVGYQCSNFYRKLIMDGVITDPNYIYVDGKLKFLRKKDGGKGRAGASEPGINGTVNELRKKRLREMSDKPKPKRKKPKRKRKGRKDDTVYADDIDSGSGSEDGGAYGYGYGGSSRTRTKKTAAKSKRVENMPELIPGLRCPMTLEPVYEPAISPYGHVMEYDTWLKVLGREPKNTCPFTKQKVTRRALVKLNTDNVEEYRDKIQTVDTQITA